MMDMREQLILVTMVSSMNMSKNTFPYAKNNQNSEALSVFDINDKNMLTIFPFDIDVKTQFANNI